MTSVARVVVVVSVLILPACSSAAPGAGDEAGPQSGSVSSTSQAPSTDSATPAGPNPFANREVRGDVATGSLWAAFYHRRSGEPVKTVWRMTGNGDFEVTATGPAGQTLQPDGAPEVHAGSNWNRPGDEWGVFWTVPRPGQWTFHAARGDRSGTVTVDFS